MQYIKAKNLTQKKQVLCGLRGIFLLFSCQTPERVKDSDERPILNGHMTVDFIAGLMEKRQKIYEAAADVTVWTDGKGKKEICREIYQYLTNTSQKNS